MPNVSELVQARAMGVRPNIPTIGGWGQQAVTEKMWLPLSAKIEQSENRKIGSSESRFRDRHPPHPMHCSRVLSKVRTRFPDREGDIETRVWENTKFPIELRFAIMFMGSPPEQEQEVIRCRAVCSDCCDATSETP